MLMSGAALHPVGYCSDTSAAGQPNSTRSFRSDDQAPLFEEWICVGFLFSAVTFEI